MTDYDFNLSSRDEDGGSIADSPNLRYCSAFGKTPEEAGRQAKIAKGGWIETANRAGAEAVLRKPPAWEAEWGTG